MFELVERSTQRVEGVGEAMSMRRVVHAPGWLIIEVVADPGGSTEPGEPSSWQDSWEAPLRRRLVDLDKREITELDFTRSTVWTLGFDRYRDLLRRTASAAMGGERSDTPREGVGGGAVSAASASANGSAPAGASAIASLSSGRQEVESPRPIRAWELRVESAGPPEGVEDLMVGGRYAIAGSDTSPQPLLERWVVFASQVPSHERDADDERHSRGATGADARRVGAGRALREPESSVLAGWSASPRGSFRAEVVVDRSVPLGVAEREALDDYGRTVADPRWLVAPEQVVSAVRARAGALPVRFETELQDGQDLSVSWIRETLSVRLLPSLPAALLETPSSLRRIEAPLEGIVLRLEAERRLDRRADATSRSAGRGDGP